MNIHINPELKRQHEASKQVRERLSAQVPLRKFEEANAKIANLEELFRLQSEAVAQLQQRNDFLKEQLIEAHGRIISQQQRICSLSEMKEEPITNRRSIQEICEEVLKDFGDVTWDIIISSRRTKAITVQRHLCYLAVCTERSDLSIAHIARKFKRDHSTILSALKKHGFSRRGDAE